jgi:hypothetical protein
MENTILDVLRELVNARSSFFRRPHLFRNRDTIASQFLDSENAIVMLLRSLVQIPITITFPVQGNFSDPVPVVPSARQISDEIEDHMNSSQQTCSICQDQIVSDGARLRTCAHVYHRACIQTWFSASVRCPICRRDIREDLSSQTSADARETISQ